MTVDLHAKRDADHLFDVVILGTGLGGGMLGAILARNGLDVLMIDSEVHPRFTIGEATTPDTNFRLKLLGTKYEVPEIADLASFHDLKERVGTSHGIKRAFSFLYEREGQPQNPAESHQYPTLAPPMGPDAHFFRQDTDGFMMATAVGYGAHVRQQTKVAEVDIQHDSVHLVTDKGVNLRGKFLVDGTGIKSVLAHKFNLREGDQPCKCSGVQVRKECQINCVGKKFRTNSRGIFTHMSGVRLYDQVGPDARKYGHRYPLSQSTLHHMFEGGWFWMIPFNNHVDSTNPLCSVGLVLNRDVHPETGMDPEEEFWSHVRKYPLMLEQFDGAKAVRPWTSSGRLQYGSTSVVGHRYCLLAHAGFFIDPLYSTGLALTTAMVDQVAEQLLHSVKTNDFSLPQFERMNDFFHRNIAYADKVVGSSFVSFRDYELWDAWYRVWVLGLFIGTATNATIYLKYIETGDLKVLENSVRPPNDMILGGRYTEFQKLFDEALKNMDAVRDGELSPKEAATRIRASFKGIKYLPDYWRWHDANSRSTPAFTLWGMTKMYFWFQLYSPKELRKPLFDWNSFTAYKYIFAAMRRSTKLARRRKYSYIRDVFKAWNFDWKTESK